MQKYDALCLSSAPIEASKIFIYLDNDIVEYLNEKCLTKQENLQFNITQSPPPCYE